jgi:hypothetical protein
MVARLDVGIVETTRAASVIMCMTGKTHKGPTSRIVARYTETHLYKRKFSH